MPRTTVHVRSEGLPAARPAGPGAVAGRGARPGAARCRCSGRSARGGTRRPVRPQPTPPVVSVLEAGVGRGRAPRWAGEQQLCLGVGGDLPLRGVHQVGPRPVRADHLRCVAMQHRPGCRQHVIGEPAIGGSTGRRGHPGGVADGVPPDLDEQLPPGGMSMSVRGRSGGARDASRRRFLRRGRAHDATSDPEADVGRSLRHVGGMTCAGRARTLKTRYGRGFSCSFGCSSPPSKGVRA